LTAALIAVLISVCIAPVLAAKTEVPLFLFSGQSNMVGLGASVNDLNAEQKKTIDNVKIYLDAEGDASKMKKWSTLGPGFGGNASGFGPELFFGKALSDSMPGKKLAFIKVARSGTYLGKTNEWMPPSSNNGTGGPYFQSMMTSIDAALKSFNSAFDTALYTPKWAGFLWFQGEFDAMDAALADKYETHLLNLITDIRTKAKSSDMPIIIPMIDPVAVWTYHAKVRAADIAATTKVTHVDTVDAKGLASDGIHFKAAGVLTIGQRSAGRWLKMKYLNENTTSSIRNMPATKVRIAPNQQPISAVFNLLGRRVILSQSNPSNPSKSLDELNPSSDPSTPRSGAVAPR
jgi:Carbohydrate esterase, sialic acid-specific acetylesterase